MLLTSLFVVPAIPNAHAAGQICLADPSTTGCPALPPTLDQAPGGLLRIAVRASGVDALNGFDIQVRSDPTILTGVSADLTGSIIPFSALVICINGLLQAGSSCAPQDADGVVHLAAVNTAGATTTPPTNGLLFTAVFKVLAGSDGTPIFFNTGCSGTSVGPDVCVTIANGVPGAPPVPVSIQEATFMHGADYNFAVTPDSTTVAPGSSFAFTITLTSQAGFTDTIGLNAVSGVGANPPSFDADGNPIGSTTVPPIAVSLSVPSLFLPANGMATATLTAGPAPDPTPGFDVNGGDILLFPTFVITATGTSSVGVSHSQNVVVQDTPQDFSISASPANGLIIPIGGSSTSTLTLTSISAFADTISFSTAVNINGPTSAVSPASVTLSAYGTTTATLTITIPTTADFAAYDITVTATSAGVTNTVDVTFVITGTDFNLAAIPDHIITFASLSASSGIKVSSATTFAGPLTFSATVIPTGTNTPANCSPCSTVLVTRFDPATATLTAGGVVFSTLSVETTANSALGNYTVVISVTSGSITHRVFLTIALGDFSIHLVTTALTVIPGTPATSTINLASLGGFAATNFQIGFNGVAYLGATNPERTRVPQLPGNPQLRLVQVYFPNGTRVPQTIIFPNGVRTCADCGVYGPIASVPVRQTFIDVFTPNHTTLTVRVTPQTPAGDYIASVTGIAGPITHTTTATVHVPASPQFIQFVPVHKVSLSRDNGIYTSKAGITNFDTTTTLFVSIQVIGIDSTGTKTFTATSIVVQLLPGQSISNLAFSAALPASTLGTRYSYSAMIQYGLTATALTASSVLGNVPSSGTLTVTS